MRGILKAAAIEAVSWGIALAVVLGVLRCAGTPVSVTVGEQGCVCVGAVAP